LALAIALNSYEIAKQTDGTMKEILERLDEMTATKRSPVAETLASVVDYLFERKTRGKK